MYGHMDRTSKMTHGGELVDILPAAKHETVVLVQILEYRLCLLE